MKVARRSALGRPARRVFVCVCVCAHMSGSGTDAHRLSRQAFTALQAFIALVGSRFGAVCMRRCIDVQSARVIIYVHGVCVCVGCICEHYKDRACAVHTGGTAWTPAKLLRIPIWVGPWVPPNTCELINLGALGAP